MLGSYYYIKVLNMARKVMSVSFKNPKSVLGETFLNKISSGRMTERSIILYYRSLLLDLIVRCYDDHVLRARVGRSLNVNAAREKVKMIVAFKPLQSYNIYD